MVRHCPLTLALLLLSGLAATPAAAQQAPRQATTIEAIRAFPGFYHLQDVIVRGEFVEASVGVVLEADGRRLDVALRESGAPAGPVEVRGQVFDVGRLEPSDPRLAGLPLPDAERWPQRNEFLLLAVASVAPAVPAAGASVRTLALEPWRFEGQTVSITGQFRGRNLFGDEPGAPARSEHDFVLRAAGGAVWVTNLEPEGRGFELRPTSRMDTDRWLTVRGVVRRVRGLVTIDGVSVELGDAVAEDDAQAAVQAPAPEVPAAVVFSIPTNQESGVPRDGAVRLQFSRGLDRASVEANLRVHYQGAADEALAVETTYTPASNSVALTPAVPFDPLRAVVVELLDGLRAFDGAPVEPFSLTFTTAP